MGEKVYTGMTPADALKMMLEPSMGRTTKSIPYWAHRMGMAPSTLYAKCNGDREITATDVVLATNATGDSLLLEAIGMATDHILISTKQGELPNGIPIIEQIADAAQQHAEAIKCACEAVKDGVATPEERESLDKEIAEMMASTARMRELVWRLPNKPQNVTRIKGAM